MILDAPTYKLVLTPEAAMGIIQKEVGRKGWKKPEIEDVRLVYVPYYSFSFDVAAEGAPPITGRAALNAHSGEISEIVPMILDRPLTKLKEIGEGEVEETSVSLAEARDAARDKLAVQTGVKKDSISVAAFTKSYVPFFRIWVNVHHEPYKAEVDALMGSMVGLEGVHEKAKSWGEATSDVLNKMKSPSGWAELGGKTVGAIAGGGGGHGQASPGPEHAGGGGIGGFFARKESRWVILLVAIGVLAWFFIYNQQGGSQCTGTISEFRGQCVLEGECGFSNPSKEQQMGMARIMIFEDGKERLDLGETVTMLVDAGGSSDVWRKQFNVTWSPGGSACESFSLKSGKV